jgi:hypothetical protein
MANQKISEIPAASAAAGNFLADGGGEVTFHILAEDGSVIDSEDADQLRAEYV